MLVHTLITEHLSLLHLRLTERRSYTEAHIGSLHEIGHLALAFRHIAGQELAPFMRARVFDPIGLEHLTWDTMGIDDGGTGIHTMPFSGVHVTARELARFGYLMLRRGQDNPYWQGAGVGIMLQGGFLLVFDLWHGLNAREVE